MSESTLQRLVRLARSAIADLGGRANEVDLERWAIDVHATMSSVGRSFHDVRHVFEVAEGGNAVQILAAMFHDTVYLQVDGGLPPRLAETLADAYRATPDGMVLVVGEDPWKVRLAGLFGFDDGQVLTPFAGLNELLSALFAVRRLEHCLPSEALLRIATCIEATVPFRPGAPGEVAEGLARRLASLDVDVDQAVRDAVLLANRDVGNFAYPDPARFLDNTWMLLPESNAQLRVRVYTVDQYHLAMSKMRGFFGFLRPEVVFRSYRGTPDDAELAGLRTAAARNIRIGYEYLSAKLLAAGVLRAIAMATGGDAPISLFMGDLPSVCATSPRLAVLLPPPQRAPGIDEDVLRLLVEGRASEGSFDLRNSPLAGYLYASCGASTHRLLEAAATEGAEVLLDRLPSAVLRPVLMGCAELAATRSDAIRGLLRE